MAFAFAWQINCVAQDCNPCGVYTNSEGKTATITSAQGFSGSAPLTVTFKANPPTSIDPATHFEWHFGEQGNRTMFIRYEADTQYTFNAAGTFAMRLYEILNGDTINIYDPITVTISESELQMPNAFSPNGDGVNDVYKAKSGYKSIIEFRAVIFNRWGQKIYEWNDPSGGWDGTFQGHAVPDGTYFVNVMAKGADGRVFKIKRDVNLLRSYIE